MSEPLLGFGCGHSLVAGGGVHRSHDGRPFSGFRLKKGTLVTFVRRAPAFEKNVKQLRVIVKFFYVYEYSIFLYGKFINGKLVNPV